MRLVPGHIQSWPKRRCDGRNPSTWLTFEMESYMSDAMELRSAAPGDNVLTRAISFFSSSVGSKVLMALTGLGLWAFMIVHLAGNLLIFAGRDAANAYSANLHHTPLILWGGRAGIVACFAFHIWAAIGTRGTNAGARPTAYAYANRTPATVQSKSMLLSGLMLLTFLVYHLAHFTWHNAHPAQVTVFPNGDVDVYNMVIRGFSVPLISLVYIAGQVLLSMHLSHGISSLAQHLGIQGPRLTPALKLSANVIAGAIALAFISIPISVLAGVIKPV